MEVIWLYIFSENEELKTGSEFDYWKHSIKIYKNKKAKKLHLINLKVECACVISGRETQFYFYLSLLLFSYSTHLQPHCSPHFFTCMKRLSSSSRRQKLSRYTSYSLQIETFLSQLSMGFPCRSAGKESAAMQETWVWSLCWEDPLKKGKATHSSILAWRIPWMVYTWGHKQSELDWVTFTFT